MPELPEITAHAERLTAGWAGASLQQVEPFSFTVLKTVDPPPDAAVGARLAGVSRRGKHLVLRFDADPPVSYVVHLMQAGRLRPEAGSSRRPNPTPSRRPRGGLLRWRFDGADALLLTEAGTERRAGVWVVRGDPALSEPLAELGPDADTLDADALADRLAGGGAGGGGTAGETRGGTPGRVRGRLHTVLRDQRVVAGIGRRLANEICHAARRSPFQPVDRLGPDDVAGLAAAIAEVLDRELAAERASDDMRSASERDTAVHGRTGEPCPACGDEIREVRYADYTIHYCAACQTGGKVLADNTTSRFLR